MLHSHPPPIPGTSMTDYIWQLADWPLWRWSDTAVAEALTAVQRKRDFLAGLARGLDAEHISLAITELMTRETVSTSAIEGVKLDADEVRSSIMRRLGLGISDGQVSRIGDAAKGVIDVLADSTQNLQPLTLDRLFAWHKAIFPTGQRGLSVILVGMLRASAEPMQIVSGPVGRERVHYEAPPADRLEPEMQRFLDWFNDGSRGLDNTLRACLAHLWFETLHPFEDGNGRLGRAVFDLALAQGAIFHSENTSRLWAVSPVILKRRKEYYAQLERAQKGDLEVTQWLQWSARCVAEACDEARECIERVVQIANFWTRHRETPFNPRQRRALQIVMAENDPEESYLTAKRLVRWTKHERVTASRDLAQLEEWGVIRKDPTVGGRSTRYFVQLDAPEPRPLIEKDG
jgi:Fic family protein